jgi:hypothetical protein
MAMRLYARQAKNRGLEADAAEIRLRAKRRVGEMMCDGVNDRASVGRRWDRKPIKTKPVEPCLFGASGPPFRGHKLTVIKAPVSV